MPGYWNGKALQWYEFFKILSLGITHLILFLFLRKLRLNTFFSFLISFITVYNLRMLDLFRFGASLEAYTGYIVLCVAMGWYYVQPKGIVGPLGIIIMTYLLVVSGHPQHMYYGMVGAGLFMLIFPFYRSDIFNLSGYIKDILKFISKTALYMIIGVLLASVYIFPFVFDFYPTNTGRADATYEWSVAPIGFFELLGNFFMPFLTDVHSAFGGSLLLTLPILLPLLAFFRIKIKRSVWVIWGIIIFWILFILGDKTPVYKLCWTYLPFLSAFRHQGRASLILPMFLMLILIWMVKEEPYHLKLKRFSVRIAPYSILAIIALLLTPFYLILVYTLKAYSVEMPPIAINNIPLWKIFLVLLSGIFSLLGLIVYGIKNRPSTLLKLFIVFMAILQVGVILRYGTFTDPLEIQPTFEQIKAQKRRQIGFQAAEVINMQTRTAVKQVKNSFMEPFLGKLFTEVVPVVSDDEAYEKMRIMRLPQQVFIEGYDTERAKQITDNARNMKKGSVELIYSSFNRLEFKIYSEAPAIFGLSYPYTGHWRAWVNGERAKVYRANGAAHAVEVPEGESIVEFRYWSDAFFWGMIITCATFVLIGCFVCIGILKGYPRFIGIILISAIGTGIFILWYSSLYNGRNFKTAYSWVYSPPSKVPNIAYGKKTLGYYPASEAQLRFHGSNAVDGDRSPGSGFILRPTNKPLIVDLNQCEEIKTILLYGEFNKGVPEISISENGRDWQRISSMEHKENPISIVFERPETARYISVKAIDSEIGIDEIEVYPPEQRL